MLPPPYPPPSSRLAGVCPAARATWGDVCSPARRISTFDDAGACMKPDLVPMGSCRPYLPVLIVHTGMTRDFMVRKKNIVGMSGCIGVNY